MKKVTSLLTFLLLASFAFSQSKINDGSFESLTWPPDGWTINPEWGDGAWQIDDGSYFGPGSAYDGTYAAMFDNYDYANGVSGSMITNTFDLSSLLFPTLSFYWWNNDVSSSPSKLQVYAFNGATYNLLGQIDTYGSGATTWVNFSMVIPANTTKIKFTGISDFGVLNTFIDKITLQEAAPVITTLELEQSTDLINWLPLGGSYPDGFTMDVDKLVAKYHLNFTATTATNVPLMEDYFGFYLNAYPSDFFAYWAEKGVVEGAGGWQAVMWEIINGNTPVFYAKVTNDKAQSVMLVDGLRYQLGQPDVYLNFDGYFPDGDYNFTGKIANSEGTESELLSIPLTLTDVTDYPEFTVVELKKSTLLPIWSTIAGDLETGFSLQLDPTIPYYYFDFTTETVTDMPIAEDYYPFLLKTDNLPEGFYEYWAAKGVFEGCTGTWEPTMWQIITGQQPIYFIKVFTKKDVGQSFMLVDGLTKLIGQPDDYFKVNGNFPLGTYITEGTITSDQGIVSLPVNVSMTFLPLPFILPFCENWDSMDFSTNYWTLDPAVGGAWSVTDEIGNPAPTALFYWDPQQIDYQNMLSSYELDGTAIPDKIFVKFDLLLSNYDSYTTEWMSLNVFDGTTWHEVGYWDNQNGDIPWTNEVIDISAFALGNVFKVAFIAGGEDTYDINYWFVDNICVYQPGQVTGIITELASGDPIGGAQVDFDDIGPITTLPDGSYELWIEPGFHDVTASATGFNPLTYTDQMVFLGPNVLNFALTAPTMTVNPDELSDVLWYGQTSTYDVVITNDGNGPLTWNAAATIVTKMSYSVNVPLTTTDKNPDSNGGIEKLPKSTTDAMFDLQFAFDVTTPTGQVSLAGAETDGNYFYAPRWNGTQIYKFDLAGNYISSFTIPGVTSIRDLAYDGTYFYGGAATNRIYQMDFTSKTLVSTIVTPLALGGVRAIAYDFVYDAFWYNNFNTPLVLVNKAGTQLNSINSGTSIYGLAYDDLTSNGPYLWLFAGTSTGGGCAVLQYDIATKLFTGVGHVVSNDFPGAIAGGLFLHENLVSGTYTLGGILQGTPDVLFGYELGLIPIKWAYLSETSGEILADVKESQTIQLTFDAGKAVPGIYEGQVIFTSDPDVGTETINLTLEILGQEIMIPAANQWGLISTYYDMNFGPKAFDPTMENLLSEIEDNMVIMIGEDGIYWPGQNINTFPDGLWNNDFAYKIKMAANDDLVFTGQPIVDKTVTYGPGVHYVPVLSEVNVSVADILAPHGNKIIFAFDLEEGLIYWPPYITTLTTLKPGFGYLVKFAATTTLNFNVAKAAGSASIVHEFENNTPWNNVTKTGDVHLIGIEEAAAAELIAGDVIGVFNNAGICSGMTQFNGFAGTSAFAVFGNDETTELNDGLDQDEMMFVRIFRNGEVFETTPVYSPEMPNSNGYFAINGLSVIESFKAGPLSVGTDPISAIRIYPNPSSGMFTINFGGISNPIEMSVTNAQGQLIYSNQVEGSMQLDLTDQPNGVYFIRLVNENSVRLEKLIIK